MLYHAVGEHQIKKQLLAISAHVFYANILISNYVITYYEVGILSKIFGFGDVETQKGLATTSKLLNEVTFTSWQYFYARYARLPDFLKKK